MAISKRLILHIGLPKTGSTAIQSCLHASRINGVKYITFPGKIDSNPIIYEFTEIHRVPRSVADAMERYDLGEKFIDYVSKVAIDSFADTVIISAEFISGLLDDVESERLFCWLTDALSSWFEITVIAYFRQPAVSRFLSVLQEDAKYNSKIKLYVSNWPYSDNVTLFKRWGGLCEKYNAEWIPVLYSQDSLCNKNVVFDFFNRARICDIASIEKAGHVLMKNKSIDPLSLCAIRRIIKSRHDLFAWDRLSELISKMSLVSLQLVSDHLLSGNDLIRWKFKKELADYISLVSCEENLLSFVNCKAKDLSGISNDYPPPPVWNPEIISNIIPEGICYHSGYLTGELECFLDGIDEDLIDKTADYIEIALLKSFSSA